MESILTSIKKLLGIAEEYTHFDADLIMHINSVFSILTQLGVGPSDGFSIEDASDTWADFIDDPKIESVKTYIHMKVKLLFDPPTASAVMESMNRTISELEWRLNAAVDTAESTDADPSTPSTGGGTTDYTKLDNLPSINGEKLIGNYDEKDPSVTEMEETDVETMWNQYFNS